ncbi:hypothetical protein B0H11DRAFT_2056993, partial [Mycena galericulata]
LHLRFRVHAHLPAFPRTSRADPGSPNPLLIARASPALAKLRRICTTTNTSARTFAPVCTRIRARRLVRLGVLQPAAAPSPIPTRVYIFPTILRGLPAPPPPRFVSARCLLVYYSHTRPTHARVSCTYFLYQFFFRLSSRFVPNPPHLDRSLSPHVLACWCTSPHLTP